MTPKETDKFCRAAGYVKPGEVLAGADMTKTTREIAAETGVSQSTAAKAKKSVELKNSTVTGKDGKKYAARKKPKQPVKMTDYDPTTETLAELEAAAEIEAQETLFEQACWSPRDALNEALALNGKCDPTKCWHYVEICALLARLDPGTAGGHHVRIDGGSVKLNLWGWRYIAHTPKQVKTSLMRFDVNLPVTLRPYTLEFVRTTKIVAASRERKDQINKARRARIAAGMPDKRYSKNLRSRIEGFSAIV